MYLTEAERARLRTLIGGGEAPARLLADARVLLKADQGEGGPGWSDAAVAGALDLHPDTVARVRRAHLGAGLEAALVRKAPDRVYGRRLDGAWVAIACSPPPPGSGRWSLRLLADELVRLEVVDALSHETVRRASRRPPGSAAGCARPRRREGPRPA